MFTHQFPEGDSFNEIASWWRLNQNVAPRAGATWFLMAKWPHDAVPEGAAVVDDYGNLVCVGWRS